MPAKLSRVFTEVVLPNAAGAGRPPIESHAEPATGGHSEVVRGEGPAGNRHFAFYHRYKPYLIKQFSSEAAALAFAEIENWEFDGEVESGFLKAYADD